MDLGISSEKLLCTYAVNSSENIQLVKFIAKEDGEGFKRLGIRAEEVSKP